MGGLGPIAKSNDPMKLVKVGEVPLECIAVSFWEGSACS